MVKKNSRELERNVTKVKLNKLIEICSRQKVVLVKITITGNGSSTANAD
jgi:capsular polysaccharide biosynthesis protein